MMNGSDRIEKLIYIIPVLCGAVASYTDVKTGKIRNMLTYPMIASGIVLNSILGGLQGFLHSIYGIGIAFILMTVLPGFRHGGGDIKLGMGFGAYIGWENTIILILFILGIIVLINIAMIIKRDGIKDFLKSLKIEIRSMGKLKTEGNRIIEGPIMLIAYVMALFFIGK